MVNVPLALGLLGVGRGPDTLWTSHVINYESHDEYPRAFCLHAGLAFFFVFPIQMRTDVPRLSELETCHTPDN
ncbi:MAG: hypothetical protein QOD00_2922 [Blastocatellia bacterium]|nr:hypothetical protein [Blastocatellia bacterium]